MTSEGHQEHLQRPLLLRRQRQIGLLRLLRLAAVLDDGIVRTLWMTPGEVRASRERHRSPLVLRCIEDHLAGRRYPLELITTDASVWNSLSI